MRAETRKIMSAFLRGERAKAKRTETDGNTVKLHGHTIAWRDESGSIWATMAGWPTTTRERLNGLTVLLGQANGFTQRNWNQFYSGEEISAYDKIKLR